MSMENHNVEEARKIALRIYLPILEERVRILINVIDRSMNRIDPHNMTPAQERIVARLQSTRQAMDRSLFNIQKYLFSLNEDTVTCPF